MWGHSRLRIPKDIWLVTLRAPFSVWKHHRLDNRLAAIYHSAHDCSGLIKAKGVGDERLGIYQSFLQQPD